MQGKMSISLKAGLGLMAAVGAFGLRAWYGPNRKCERKCGGGGDHKHGGHGHRHGWHGHGGDHKHGAGGHRHHGEGECHGKHKRCGTAADGTDSDEKIEADEKSDPTLKTAIDVKKRESVTKDAIKADTTSALAMMQSELKPLSDEFVAFVKAKWNFPAPALERLNKLFDYNLTGGKCFRGVFVINTTRYLCQSRGLNWAARKKKAVVLAWCIEILQACFLVADDLMDGSLTRRGKPCWYKVPEVGHDAVNDSLILESFIYFLIEKYFGHSRIELDLYKLYHEVSLQTQLGQMLDLTSNPQGKWDPKLLGTFNIDVYKRIVQFKTAYYSFYLPVASAMILCGTTSKPELEAVNNICIAIGEKFQIQDDWLDCYGDPEKIGKVGTDIADHKCSWLLVQALLRCSAAQLSVIQSNYGKSLDDKVAMANVKQVFADLQLTAVYNEQEEKSYAAILKSIEAADSIIPSPILFSLLVLIHKREK